MLFEVGEMASRDQIIDKIRMLSEESLSEVADFLDQMDEKSKTKSWAKRDLLYSVIGICEGPADLAERHDKYAYE
jgi:hypothetical protein